MNFEKSMASMILAPGNLYTDGSGDLLMAANYYQHIYNNAGNFANDASWSINNRTHFNFNELYCLMKGEALDRSKAYTNQGSFEDTEKTFSSKNWRVPTQADWTAMTTGARPGAKLNATVTSTSTTSSTTGWKFIKVLVNGMGSAGTSSADGTAALAADATAPSTDHQAGLLIFPDNVEINGTFTTLGTKNTENAAFNTTTITKTDLDALISKGCAFLPGVGRWYNGSFGYVGAGGVYWTCTQYDDTDGYNIDILKGSLTANVYNTKSGIFRSVRLVRDLQ